MSASVTLKSKKRDFTEGPIFKSMLLYTIPIILTALLQLCYNMADNIVVGRWSGEEFALAAVGATGPLNNLIVNLLMGIGAGGAIVVAHAFGAKDYDKLSRAVHTSVTFSFIGGIIFGLIFFLVSKPALTLMGIDSAFIDLSVKYMRILAFGIPASSVYNYSAAILRSVGDSRSPLIILSCSGLINVGLNLIFVICFNMDVDGVAIATIISQYISAAAAVTLLVKRKNMPYAFSFKKMAIDKKILIESMRLGIPSGIQASMFSISNMIIVSSMNSFGPYVYTGYTINSNIDSILYCICSGFSTTCLTFTAQNYGAKNIKRIHKALLYSIVQAVSVGFICGQIILLFTDPLAMLFMPENQTNIDIILKTTRELTKMLLSTYFLLGVLSVISGALRGIGYSILQMILYIIGLCGTRVFWVYIIFPLWNSPVGLMVCYPASWIVSIIFLGAARVIAEKKLKIKLAVTNLSEEENKHST